MNRLSIEYNLQLSIIKSLCVQGIISVDVAEQYERLVKQQYLKIVQNMGDDT